ncbi:mucin-19-like [Paramacrobiotus metropolitanus]|uniref:mucin-19-like n=1 Tax=Paramacrobiotus metropolitanus TaxID=2943436 RepID=UPI0024456306|nr:mucin-19-like [Paramacrobiotus metropolitanus]
MLKLTKSSFIFYIYLVFLYITFAGAIQTSMRKFPANHKHALQKRQTAGSAPTFGQGSYSFTATSCNTGTNVGTVTASANSVPGQVGYTIDPQSVQGFNAIIGYLTGVVTLANNAPSTFSFNVLASTSAGTTSVPVTVTCPGSTNGLGIVSCPFNNGTCTNTAVTTTISPLLLSSALTSSLTNPYLYNPFGTTGLTYPFTGTTGLTYPYTGTTGLTYPYTGTTGLTYPYTGTTGLSYPYGTSTSSCQSTTGLTGYPYTGTTGLTGYPYTGYPYTGTTGLTGYPYGYPYTGTTGTTQQTFTVTNCYTPGSYVGQVCYPGASGYLISGSQFTINANSGIITLLTPLTTTTGTLTANVQAYLSTGQSITLPVTIIASCFGSTGIYPFGTTTGTGFLQPSYTFTATTCTAGTAVGTVQAYGALGYYITNGNTQFTISTAGTITMLTAVPAGTYTLLVASTSTTGLAGTTVPVTITVTCSGTTTGVATFPQTSYTLSTSSCTAGSSVGSVTATNANSYSITSTGSFAISTAGAITLSSALSAGTYTGTVTATGTLGSASVPVTITVTCGGTSTGGTGAPVFAQPFYGFTLSTCGTSAAVGTVTATNAASYAINYGSGNFAIDASGNITATSVSAGVYSLTVVATNSSGVQQAIPVTVTVTCTTG